MANLSDVNGTISVQIRTPGMEESYEEFWKALAKTQKGDYSFHYSDDYSLNQECVNFYGTGRWAFETNLTSFGPWAVSVLDSAKDGATKQFLENLDFTLTFEFTDYEPGCGVFYSEVAAINHNAGTELTSVEYECVSSEEIERCAYNMVKYGFAESILDYFRYEWANEYDEEAGKFTLEYETEFESVKNDLKKSIIAYMGGKSISRSVLSKLNEEFKDYERFTYKGRNLIINEVTIREGLFTP